MAVIQNLINAASPGAVITVPAGVYRESFDVNKAVEVRCGAGVEVTATDDWSPGIGTTWTPSGTFWTSTTQVPGFTADMAPEVINNVAGVNMPEQVFINGVEQFQVAPGGSPGPGQFCLVSTSNPNRFVRIGTDPGGKLVEVTTRTTVATISAANAKIRGTGVTDRGQLWGGASQYQHGVVDVDDSTNTYTGVVVEYLDVSYGHSAAIGVAGCPGITIRGCDVHHSGVNGLDLAAWAQHHYGQSGFPSGFGGSGYVNITVGATVTDNDIHDNISNGGSTGWHAAGFKCTQRVGTTTSAFIVARNRYWNNGSTLGGANNGCDVWFDTKGATIQYGGNDTTQWSDSNWHMGGIGIAIRFEVNEATTNIANTGVNTIRYNRIANYQGTGIWSDCNNGITIDDNVIAWCRQGLIDIHWFQGRGELVSRGGFLQQGPLLNHVGPNNYCIVQFNVPDVNNHLWMSYLWRDDSDGTGTGIMASSTGNTAVGQNFVAYCNVSGSGLSTTITLRAEDSNPRFEDAGYVRFANAGSFSANSRRGAGTTNLATTADVVNLLQLRGMPPYPGAAWPAAPAVGPVALVVGTTTSRTSTTATLGSVAAPSIGATTRGSATPIGTLSLTPAPPAPAEAGGFIIPNRPDVVHPDIAEPDAVDYQILAAGSALIGVVTGLSVGPTSPATMGVRIAAGTSINSGVQYPFGAPVDLAVAVADATSPRFDLVVVTDAGARSVITGTPSDNPVFPTLPLGSAALASVYVPAGTTAITTSLVVSKRVFVKTVTPSDVTAAVGPAPPAVVYANDPAYGAVGDGTTPTQNAVLGALNAAASGTGGGEVVFDAGTYRIDQLLSVAVPNGKTLSIRGRGKVVFSVTPQVGAPTAPLLAISGSTTSRLVMENVEVVNATAPTSSTFGKNALDVRTFERVTMRNVRGTKAAGWGINVVKAARLTVEDCVGSDNRYGGLGFSSCTNVRILGGEYSDNGAATPDDGYGVSAQTVATGGDPPNKNVLIQGVTLDRNQRHAIDVHSGRKVVVRNCFIDGVATNGKTGAASTAAAIYAVNQGVSKDVGDVIVEGCEIDVSAASAAVICYLFEVGSVEDGTTPATAMGSVKLKNNICRGQVSNAQTSAVFVWNPSSGLGPALDRLEITGNDIRDGSGSAQFIIRVSNNPTILDTVVVQDNYLHTPTTTGGGVLVGNTNRTSIVGNTLVVDTGTVTYGIWTEAGRDAIVSLNQIRGAGITTLTAVVPAGTAPANKSYRGNLLNGVMLADS